MSDRYDFEAEYQKQKRQRNPMNQEPDDFSWMDDLEPHERALLEEVGYPVPQPQSAPEGQKTDQPLNQPTAEPVKQPTAEPDKQKPTWNALDFVQNATRIFNAQDQARQAQQPKQEPTKQPALTQSRTLYEPPATPYSFAPDTAPPARQSQLTQLPPPLRPSDPFGPDGKLVAKERLQRDLKTPSGEKYRDELKVWRSTNRFF